MKWRTVRARLLVILVVVLGVGAAFPASAIDVAWMQTGVRAWYFGGVETGGPTSSDAEEAYLLGTITGTSVEVIHHSAQTHWTLPKPTIKQSYSLQGQGPWWIHPQVLQSIDDGDYWLGQRITYVQRKAYTWATFPYHTLPINALFDLQPQREIVRLTYMMDLYNIGVAYFDAETGIMLYYDTVWPTGVMFFILSQINYDFENHTAFAEDDGPHVGYHSWANETSQGNLISGGGMVDIHSQVESRYGADVEMWVITNLTGPTGFKPQTYENYAFFGNVPIVTRIAHDQAGSVRPEQWTPYGKHLWWWLPANATGAAEANQAVTAQASATIDVFDVSMTRTADFPITFEAVESPQRFHFTSLVFGDDGFLRVFSAKDPTIGLDVKPTDFNFWNQTVTHGTAYFRRSMTDDAFPSAGQIPAGWITMPGANAGWLVVNDQSYKGTYSLKSAAIGDNQAAGIQVSGNFQAGEVSFAARVSSEQGHDYFMFYVDGVAKIGGAGNIDWTMISVPVEAGVHTFRWVYAKNGSSSAGSDAAWIDAVVLPGAGVRGPSMVVPVVAQTGSYATEAHVRNDHAEPITLDVHFYEANNSSVPGPRTCSQFMVPAHSTRPLTLSTQCALGAGSHFGMLILKDVAGSHDFTVYSRSQTPAGVGFSVEGTPIESFSAAPANVEGLRRTATGAHYLSNCFVGALDSAVDYRLDLLTADDLPLGNPITGSLQPFRMVRYLDVLGAAGVPAGDYNNVRGRFTETGAGSPPFVGFCTMQESVTYGADFRLAKPSDRAAAKVVVPVVAQTGSYNTEVHVRNANAQAITLNVKLYEADNSSVPGQRPCSQFTVPANATRPLLLGTQCVLGSGSHFGMLVLENASGAEGFTVFSRSQTPAGVGFSVEGFPAGDLGAGPVTAEGLKRSSTAPYYLANCFVGALGMDLDYRIDLTNSDDAPIGVPLTGSLQANHTVRFLDVLAAAKAPAGNHAGVRAKFSRVGPGDAPLVGFCTLQESVTFSADFRIGK